MKQLAERRTDIFGVEETAIGKKIGEEEIQKPEEKVEWKLVLVFLTGSFSSERRESFELCSCCKATLSIYLWLALQSGQAGVILIYFILSGDLGWPLRQHGPHTAGCSSQYYSPRAN